MNSDLYPASHVNSSTTQVPAETTARPDVTRGRALDIAVTDFAKSDPPSAGRRARRRRSRWSMVAGVAAALFVANAVLAYFSTGVHRSWEPIASDSVGGRVVTQRWYYEGVATSHFSAAHARLTGNPYLPGAPVGVILGDSYVEALQMDDASTMGSVIERTARREGQPLNIRQYGVSGASAARYVAEARDVVRRWQPAFVAVVLTEDDFAANAPFVGDYRLRLAADSTVTVTHDSAALGPVAARSRSTAASFLEHVTLADKIVVRAARILESARGEGEGPAAPTTDSRAVYASIRGLHAAYGARLLIVYVPTIAAVPSEDDSRSERAFLSACAAVDARCISAGETLRRDRALHHRVSRGFSNSAPGTGHLNATGAALVGSLIWSSSKPLMPNPPASGSDVPR